MRSRLLAVLLAGLLVLAGCLGTAEDAVESATSNASEAVDEIRNVTNESERVAPGWPDIGEAQIRPGVNVVDGSCTSNFLFRTPDNRTLFLGTAAHCVDDKNISDSVAIRGGQYEGKLAYSSFHAMEQRNEDINGNDFALIELPDSARSTVHPAMLTFGGPTGIATDVSQGEKVYAHGNSTVRPDAAPDEAGPREGYVTHHDEWRTGVYFDGPGIPGDSGSAVTMADGRALGTLVTVEFAPEPASNNVANLAATLSYANDVLDDRVELVTWSQQAEGDLPSLSGSQDTDTAITG